MVTSSVTPMPLADIDAAIRILAMQFSRQAQLKMEVAAKYSGIRFAARQTDPSTGPFDS